MGMNYYLVTGRKTTKVCDLGFTHEIDEVLHVGKSSYGRYFTLHKTVAPDGTKLDCLEAWKKYVEDKCPDGWFQNEGGNKVSMADMVDCITRTNWEPSKYAQENFTEDMVGTSAGLDGGDVWGERGFVRTKIDEVGKDGLYVLLDADFS